MRTSHGTFAVLGAIVFLFTFASEFVRANEETGILVLQDGGVLTGQITRAADWYIVARGGGQMQIAQSRVMLVCRTMDEAYEFRRQQLGGLKAADHLRLAEWCIRYDLPAEAGRELAEARQ